MVKLVNTFYNDGNAITFAHLPRPLELTSATKRNYKLYLALIYVY